MTRDELLEALLVERFGVLPVQKPVHTEAPAPAETVEPEGVITIEQASRRRALSAALKRMSA